MTQVYFGPKVTLIGATRFIPAPHINWTPDTDHDAETLSEFAGRLCYLSFGEHCGIEGHKTIPGRTSNKEYFSNVLRTRHGSVCEHNLYAFLFEGISRSLTHELVRHRHLQFSQLSQRYVDESDVGFVVPPEMGEDSDSDEFHIWFESCKRAKSEYARLLRRLADKYTNHVADMSKTVVRKRMREAARSVLPNCTETKIVVSGNARAWRHFLTLRGSLGADREIRRLALLVGERLKQESPSLFQDVEFKVDTNGNPYLEVIYGSV